MQFIHSKGIVHRDLKLSDVVVDEWGYPRITDAGIARWIELDIAATTQLGSSTYLAPEMYNDEYERASESYAFALILYELLVGKPVFNPGAALGVVMNQIMTGARPEIPRSMNETVKDIIQKGWAVDPTVRYSFDEIWSRLEGINFQLTGDVNTEHVCAFISWLKQAARSSPVPPVSRVDMRWYAFWAPQEGFRQSFSLPFERNATAKVVREEVARHLAVLKKWADRVQLLSGRILRDSIVLDNLQIGDGDVIVVYVRKFTNTGFSSARSLTLDDSLCPGISVDG
jgi:serine/threonine protein kinase